MRGKGCQVTRAIAKIGLETMHEDGWAAGLYMYMYM